MSASPRYAFTAAATAAPASGTELTISQSYRPSANCGTGVSVDRDTPNRSLQHTLNNPLGGLLAELQLLEMDDLTQAQREGIERSIALCRRVIQIVRDEIPAG